MIFHLVQIMTGYLLLFLIIVHSFQAQEALSSLGIFDATADWGTVSFSTQNGN